MIGYAPRKSGRPESFERGDQPVGERRVAGDLAVRARARAAPARPRTRPRSPRTSRRSSSLPGTPACWPRRSPGRFANFALDEVDRALGRPVVEPRHQPEREEVLRALRLARRDPLDPLQRADGHRRERDLVDVVVGERAVLERVRPVAGLLQRAVVEGVGVDDDRAALRHVGEVRLERRRVHRDEHVRPVARGEDVVVGEVHLEPGDAGQRPGRARGSRRGSRGRSRGRCRAMAVSLVKRSPVSCIPSPESPAKRMITPSRCSTFFVLTSGQRSARARSRCRRTAVSDTVLPPRGARHRLRAGSLHRRDRAIRSPRTGRAFSTAPLGERRTRPERTP